MLQQAEGQLRLHDRAMSASSCGITIADVALPDMPLIYVNEAFARITGYAVSETVGLNCRFLQRDDRHQPGVTALRTAIHAGEHSTVLLRNYRKSGEPFWNELFVSPVYDENCRLTHFVGIQTDVTARVEAEQALQRTLDELRQTQAMLVHSEKMNALGQLVAGVAHEVNNPVSFVNSNLHSLREGVENLLHAYTRLESLAAQPGGASADALQRVRAQGDIDFLQQDLDDLLRASLDGLGRVKHIVEQLRAFSRLDEAARKAVDLRENIESTLLIARGMLHNIQVNLDVAPDLPPLLCYPAELNQAMLNMVINAAQAMPDGGTLNIRAFRDGNDTVIQVADTGVGMSPDVQARVFDPFFTTKPVGQGTGLGMTIAYRIITQQHGGQISVDSQAGRGTTFTVRLPKATGQ